MRSAFILICLVFLVSTTVSQNTPNSTATPTPLAMSDKEAYDKAMALRSLTDIEQAMKEFIERYPDSSRVDSARTTLASVRVNIAEQKFINGDAAAVEIFRSAVEDAPQPIPEKLFDDRLSKIPGRLYLGGEWQGAYRVAEELELKIQDDPKQLAALAGFYLSVEDGERAIILARRAVELDENSAASFAALGLAQRLVFNFNEAEAAFSKAVELDPDSAGAKRGLAEIKRALGKYPEAVQLYNELIEQDAEDISAQTGKILTELEFADRDRVEDELDAALEQNPQNVQLLAGAAYWYAVRGNAEKALDFSDLALAVEPRYIWAHIARARGFMLQGKPMEAEKVLLTARRVANFPTLEYEIAMARYEAGFYKEAADDLSKLFSVKDGRIITKLGGRIEKHADTFIDLIGLENKASIFISQNSKNDNAGQKLKELLQLKADISSQNESDAAASARKFASGSDSMKLYRHLFAAEILIDNNIANDTALDLVQDATRYTDAASKENFAAVAIMANELYDVRRAAFIQGEYINQPSVPQQTIVAIIRGRMEEMSGMALQSAGKNSDAVVRYNRALSILPANSAWSRSVNWRLGLIEREKGNEKKALEHFIKSYDITRPDIVKYTLIAAMFTKLNGSIDDLDRLIGPNPMPLGTATEPGEKMIEPETEKTDDATEESKSDEEKEKQTENEEETLPKETDVKETVDEAEKKPLFEPIIIGGKRPEKEAVEVEANDNSDAGEKVLKGEQRQRLISNTEPDEQEGQCRITLSQDTIVLRASSGSLGILAGVEGVNEPIDVRSESPDNISVTIEKDPSIITSKTFFVIRSVSGEKGEYEIKLKAGCGERTVKVTVR